MIKEVFALSMLLMVTGLKAQDVTIPVSTDNSAILLQTDRENRLRTIYFGEPLDNEMEYALVSGGYQYYNSNAGIYNAAYTPAGTWNISEPAIQVVHGDGNSSLDLKYMSHKKDQLDDNTTLTSIVLEDDVYPFRVTLFYKSWK
jgi:alpha-galactosidase